MRAILSALLAFSLVAVTAGPASAQGFHLGAEAGVAFTGQFIETAGGAGVGTEPTSGLRAGVSAAYGFGEEEYFALRSGLYYAQKGSEIDVGGGTTQEMGVDYLEVPLLAVFNLPVESRWRPRVYGGGQLGLELSCELEDPSTGQFESCSNANVTTASTDFGLVFGGGLGYAVGEATVLSLDGGYVFGLTNIEEGGLTGGEVNNRAIYASASVEFAM